jgi:hypothetical protein
MGKPANHPYIDRCSIISHPAIGVFPFMETLIYIYDIIYIAQYTTIQGLFGPRPKPGWSSPISQ